MDRPIAPRHRWGRQGLAVGAACLALGSAAYGYWRYGLQRSYSVGAERISVATVGYGTFSEYIPITGHVVPNETVFLDAIEGGQVTEVLVEEGALVTAGERLVRLKNTRLELEVIGREAQLTEQLNALANTRLGFEQNRLQRQRELLEIEYQLALLTREIAQKRPLLAVGGVTQTELDGLQARHTYYERLNGAIHEAEAVEQDFRRTQLAGLEEALSAMNANLDIARGNLDDLTIVAPIDGQLTLLEAEIGESKAPGVRIGQIDQVDSFKVAALIDEFYLARVVPGQTASVDLARRRYALQTTKIYPGVQDRQFKVDLEFLGPPTPDLRRGQTLRLRLEIGEPGDALMLANGAFYDDTGGQWIFVVDPARTHAERRSVRLGRRNIENIEVLAGLTEGEQVITSSYSAFIDLDRIELRDSGP